MQVNITKDYGDIVYSIIYYYLLTYMYNNTEDNIKLLTDYISTHTLDSNYKTNKDTFQLGDTDFVNIANDFKYKDNPSNSSDIKTHAQQTATAALSEVPALPDQPTDAGNNANQIYLTAIKQILNKYLKINKCDVANYAFTDPEPHTTNENIKINNTDDVFVVYINKVYNSTHAINTNNNNICLYVAYHNYYVIDDTIQINHTAIFYDYQGTYPIKLHKNVTSVFIFHMHNTDENNEIWFDKSYNVREIYIKHTHFNITQLKSFPMLACLYLSDSRIIDKYDDIFYINHVITEITQVNKKIIPIITDTPNNMVNYNNIYEKIHNIYPVENNNTNE